MLRSRRSCVTGVVVVLSALLYLPGLAHASSIQRSELDNAILYKELDDLQDVVDHALAASSMAGGEEPDPDWAEDLPSQVPDSLRDAPLLSALFRAAAGRELRTLTGRKSPLPLPEEGGELPAKRGAGLKRGFDSISQNSGFGMHRGSFGGGNGGGDNLTFTFESLFPAIARGLRSTK